jgi:decaprenylphospho-beta-D-ribofuranose 2-oxidase
LTVKIVNALRFAIEKNTNKTTDYRNFHYPVDALKHWNRLYGSRGFQEYQFLVPADHIKTAYNEFVRSCKKFSLMPFFTIVKKFGTVPREGLLSFPKAGFTMMADFDTRPENQKLFTYFTELLLELEGRIYLAKDSYLTRDQFEKMEPNIEKWRDIVMRYDPQNHVKSDLSVRLGMKPW